MRKRAAARWEVLERRTLLAAAGPDGYGYRAFDQEPQLIDLAPGDAGVVVLLDGLDNAAAAVPLGANTFRFYGTTYTGNAALFASTNGLITLGSASSGASNSDLSGSPSAAAIAPLWDN